MWYTAGMTTIYLDTCSLHRPVDDKSHGRIAVEAEAILAVLALCETGTVVLITSAVITFEVERNPHPQRKAFVLGVLAAARQTLAITDATRQRAKTLEAAGFRALDALHLAVAEAGHVTYFCTCDDRLLKKAKTRTDITLRVVSPLELAQEVLP
jgi:predicted nucleic acid-binding protein